MKALSMKTVALFFIAIMSAPLARDQHHHHLSSMNTFLFVKCSKEKNRAVLREKFGVDCGTHCTNAVVKLTEAKIEQEKYVYCLLNRLITVLERHFVVCVCLFVCLFYAPELSGF